MAGGAEVVLTLVVADDDGRPTGTVTSAEGRSWPFSGWIELAEAVESMRAGANGPVGEGEA